MAEVRVTGLSELQGFLETLPTKIQNNVMRGALRAGMNVVKDSAVQGAAHATGIMREGIKVTTRNRAGVVSASVKAKGKHAPLAHLVEYGTAAHRISAKDGSALSFGGGAVQHVDHPGQRARPFMRPALDAQGGNAVVAAAEYMRTRLANQYGLDTADILIEGDE